MLIQRGTSKHIPSSLSQQKYQSLLTCEDAISLVVAELLLLSRTVAISASYLLRQQLPQAVSTVRVFAGNALGQIQSPLFYPGNQWQHVVFNYDSATSNLGDLIEV